MDKLALLQQMTRTAAQPRPRRDAGIVDGELSFVSPSDKASSSNNRDHSGLRPVNFTTLLHLSVSSAMNRPNSDGDPASGSPPISVNFVLIPGSVRAALISRFNLSMIPTGVFFGAAMPYHWLAS